MKTYDNPTTVGELVSYYCPRCVKGLNYCPKDARDCWIIQNDKAFKSIKENEKNEH